MLYDDWRGYLIAGFSLVWVANVYMSLYSRLRMDIKTETLESKIEEKKLKERLELLTKEFNEFKINSESLNNSFSLELFKIKDKYGLLNW